MLEIKGIPQKIEVTFNPFYGKSDKENLISLLEHMGLRRSDCLDWSSAYGLCVEEFMVDPVVVELDKSQHTENRVVIGSGNGYSGFYCYFDFDENGKYKGHACAE